MVIIGTILLIIALAIGWIIFVPVILIIDTDSKRYFVFQRGTVMLAFHPDQPQQWDFKIVGITIKLQHKTKVTPKSTAKKKNKKGFKKSLQSWLFLIKRSAQSFKVKKFYLNVDTDDVVLNAQLVPLTQLLNHEPVLLATNFTGNVNLNFELETRLYKLIWAFILFLTKK